ncbi:MAG: lytic murein transglycosylase [Alphaproteobacteria bacterium]
MESKRLRTGYALVAALAVLAASIAVGHAATFAEFVASVRKEARAQGIAEATLDSAFAGVSGPIARIIELDRSQPEVTMTFAEYMAKRVTDAMVRDGQANLASNRALLEQVEARYGVPVEYLVALWGLESRFGEYMGQYSVIAALATLAYDGRRSTYFRKELLNALAILDEGHTTPDLMLGSWAGAMGQSQFMPSSFRSYAVDFDSDGRRDIWTTRADVFASAANYLAKAGWRRAQAWGFPVVLPDGFESGLIGNRTVRDVGAWRTLGVAPIDGHDFPADSTKAALVRPAGERGVTYMVFDNYQVILRWNRSDYFAMSVVTLADLLAAAGTSQ